MQPDWSVPVISSSDITVIFPAVFETWEPVWMMLHTCKRFGIEPKPYGFGDTYDGWVNIKLNRLLEAVKEVETSHVLYTDASDAFFLTGLDEITRKYNDLGCPPLFMAAEASKFPTYMHWYNEVTTWDESLRFPYPHVGGRLDERDVLIDALGWMMERYQDMPGDDCAWWVRFVKDWPGELKWDSTAEIFMSAGNAGGYDPGSDLQVENGRLFNLATGSWPCILHLNGGYSEPGRGKWYALESWWRKLGYTENPPWTTR
jgi:hypothetical protein